MSSACLARVAALCLSIFPSGLPPRAAAQSSQLQVRKPISRSLYVGDEVCASCHRSSFETFTHTAHHLTSQVAGVHSIAGSFTTGANTLSTSNPGLHFRMDAKSGRFFETALWGIPPDTKPERKPIDVVIGSGRKGQTYLYWKGDRLFQLPVSYWVDLGQWVNSPGSPTLLGVSRFLCGVAARTTAGKSLPTGNCDFGYFLREMSWTGFDTCRETSVCERGRVGRSDCQSGKTIA
jgi:hypothetical protein